MEADPVPVTGDEPEGDFAGELIGIDGPAGEDTEADDDPCGDAPLGPGTTGVDDGPAGPVSVSVTGQMVVDTGIVEVTTTVE